MFVCCLLFSICFFVCLFLFVCFWCVYRFVGMWIMRRVAHLLFPRLPASASHHLSTAGFHQSLSCLTTAIHQRTMPAASIVVKSWGLVPTVWYVETEKVQFIFTEAYQFNCLVKCKKNPLLTRYYFLFLSFCYCRQDFVLSTFPFLCTDSVWGHSSLSGVSMGPMGSPVWPLIMAVSLPPEEMDTADSSL